MKRELERGEQLGYSELFPLVPNLTFVTPSDYIASNLNGIISQAADNLVVIILQAVDTLAVLTATFNFGE